ncbi:MAG: glycosyltransferase family 4 protein [Kiritimatiellaeota bacterium]|nr:glycosyltransferase family 4 protein [Kiritimatiellota bacterium]
MRIGFIEDTNLRGGTQIWVSEAARKFIEAGEEIVILAPTDSFVANECEAAGAKVFGYDWDDISLNPDEYKRVWTDALAVMDVAVCTVHPPRNGFHCSVFAGECLKSGNLETILIPKTGTIVPEYKREYYIPNDSINVQVVCITNFTKRYLIDEYAIPEEKVTLIYQGTEVDRFTSTEETVREAYKRYKLPDDAAPVLGSVGSFEERKGQTVLLETAAKLAAGPLPDVHAMLVGEGPDEAMLKSFVVDMNLEKHVSFFSFTRQPNFIFDRIDILTLPSLYKEGLPNVLLEAMSMGLPVVSSRMAGVPEIVFDGETGYMTEPGKVGELADVIVKLWSDQDAYKRMGRKARELMETKFDKKIQFGKFLEFFRSLKGAGL